MLKGKPCMVVWERPAGWLPPAPASSIASAPAAGTGFQRCANRPSGRGERSAAGRGRWLPPTSSSVLEQAHRSLLWHSWGRRLPAQLAPTFWIVAAQDCWIRPRGTGLLLGRPTRQQAVAWQFAVSAGYDSGPRRGLGMTLHPAGPICWSAPGSHASAQVAAGPIRCGCAVTPTTATGAAGCGPRRRLPR